MVTFPFLLSPPAIMAVLFSAQNCGFFLVHVPDIKAAAIAATNVYDLLVSAKVRQRHNLYLRSLWWSGEIECSSFAIPVNNIGKQQPQ